MIVHQGHRIEDLLEALVGVVARPAGPAEGAPLRSEIIAVQGRGMERWLSMELSRRFGVWACPAFPFPRRLIEQAFDAVLGPADASGRVYEPETLTWAVASALPELLPRPPLAPLRAFLGDDPDGDRRLQLAAHVADTLDRYVVYRPDRLRAWEQGAERDDWQAMLWRELVARHGTGHLATRAADFLAALDGAGGASDLVAPGARLPARVSLFGLTTLPPLYVEVLAAMGRFSELHLFVLRCARNGPAAAASPLWWSLGGVGRDFEQVLEERGVATRSLCAGDGPSPQPDSLLGCLQQAIREGGLAHPAPLDASIAVHACHSPLREVEVLHDRLVQLFEDDASLEPRDVIVMTPDIERYAPFVEAVFQAPARQRGERPYIPHRLADQSLRATHDVADAFDALVDALSGRLTASAVVDLLLVERIRRRFGIEPDDLDPLLEWIREAGIRWGADAAHRAERGQPAAAQNTWRLGLDRLLLGLAMDADSPFHGVLPATGVDPGLSELLGRFTAFCEALLAHRPGLCALHPVSEWSGRLCALLRDLVDDRDEASGQHAWLREALAGVAARAEQAGFAEPVPLASIRRQLDAQLRRDVPSHGFLAGGVTFCELVPMRSIPFRVVALLGMDDGAFPRHREPLGFDLVARDPRCGDRSRREDDRYLFLEALLSARDRLLVSYVGRSIRDGARLAPAVVVDELLDELGRITGRGGQALREALVQEHPLHGFSPRYFVPGAPASLFSYSASDRRGAQALLEARREGVAGGPFVTAPLARPADAERVVRVDELARFLEHPVRAFLQRRLGLYLRDEVEEVLDREPLDLSSLDQWKLRDRLLRELEAGVPPEDARERMRARGDLPPGTAGELACERELARAGDLLAVARELAGGPSRPALQIDRELAGWRLTGEVGELYTGARVEVLLSRLPHRRELGFWLRHLLLCWTRTDGQDGPEPRDASGEEGPRQSFLVGRREKASEGEPDVLVLGLPPVVDAESVLRDLLALYDAGLRAPLPFPVQAAQKQAFACFDPSLAPGTPWPLEPIDAARDAWERGGGASPPDRDDAYLLQAFRDVDPLDPEAPLPGDAVFGRVVQRVYEPYLRVREVRS